MNNGICTTDPLSPPILSTIWIHRPPVSLVLRRRVMKRCLYSSQLLRRGRSSSWSLRRSIAVSPRCRLSWSTRTIEPSRPGASWRGRSYASVTAVADSPPPPSLEDCLRRDLPKPPVSGERQKDPTAWFPFLEGFLLPLSSRAGAGVESIHSRAWDLATVLASARFHGHFDLLTEYGSRTGHWSNVDALFGQMLGATEDLRVASALPLSVADWGEVGELSFDDITSQSVCDDFGNVRLISRDTPGEKVPSLDKLSDRPYSTEFTQRIMAQVWQSLGSIVLQAADQPYNEYLSAMSCVFHVLARLHHSGAISDNLYKASPRLEPNKVTSRPPGLHLLSTHIVSVLSEMAWRAHEAEVTAKAAAMGEDSPYVPFKMNIRELGPELWLELILWCCVEQGYAREGLWIIEQMTKRTGDLAWRFESWDALLQDPEALFRKTNVDVEAFWRRPGSDVPSRQAKEKSSIFHGLGKRTISLEIISSLRDSLVNLSYLGVGYRGLSPSLLLTYVSRFGALINGPAPNDEPQPTSKEMNWFITRVTESGGLDLNRDPQAFEAVLRASPHVMPPWDDRPSGFAADLEQLAPSQLYNDTAAFTGLMEYTVRYYALEGKTGQAFKCFNWLQKVVDASKSQHVEKFLARMNQDTPGRPRVPLADIGDDFMSPKALESSVPQVSNVTYAGLVELSSANRVHDYGDWLLFSTDLDGPPIHPNEYGSQTLAPALLRFAAITKNQRLYQRVVTSIKQPFSLNTLRALITYRILTGDFDRVVLMLEFIRDNRLKSWGHHNVTALASVIVRLEHGQDVTFSPPVEREQTLARAKGVLLRIMNGEFNDQSEQKLKSRFHQLALRNIHKLFLSIPGSLAEVAAQSRVGRPEFDPNNPDSTKYIGHTTSTSLPYIPDVAFNQLLAAVVDTHGSAMGKRLWKLWCLDTVSPSHRLFREGGIIRLQTKPEWDHRVGDRTFDPVRASKVYQKLVVPNLNTVRVIAQKAAEEFMRSRTAAAAAAALVSHETVSSLAATDTDAPIEVLNFCIKQFRVLRLPDAEIDNEFMGYLGWLQEKARQEKSADLEEREKVNRFLRTARSLDYD